jgi:hypothetical protein
LSTLHANRKQLLSSNRFKLSVFYAKVTTPVPHFALLDDQTVVAVEEAQT